MKTKKSKVPAFQQWKSENREVLITRFSREFGTQIHEWPDFVERAFEKAKIR